MRGCREQEGGGEGRWGGCTPEGAGSKRVGEHQGGSGKRQWWHPAAVGPCRRAPSTLGTLGRGCSTKHTPSAQGGHWETPSPHHPNVHPKPQGSLVSPPRLQAQVAAARLLHHGTDRNPRVYLSSLLQGKFPAPTVTQQLKTPMGPQPLQQPCQGTELLLFQVHQPNLKWLLGFPGSRL